MDRNRVGAEGVHDDGVERIRWRSFQQLASVTDIAIPMGTSVREEREEPRVPAMRSMRGSISKNVQRLPASA
jgi:hypothetical protein